MNGTEYELNLEIFENYEVIDTDKVEYEVSIGGGESVDAATLLGCFESVEELAEWDDLESYIGSLIASIGLKREQEAMIFLVNKDTGEKSLIITISINKGCIKYDLDDYRIVLSERK